MIRVILLAALLPIAAVAETPAALASALEHLRQQRSYSWEVINGDPGVVAHRVPTRRGVVSTLQQSAAPSMHGSIDRAGDILVRREWPDGIRLDTLMTAQGDTVTLTPEGWMTGQEILTAQAEERIRNAAPTAKGVWLRRADRPDIRRPDEELTALIGSATSIQRTTSDTYVARSRVSSANGGTEDYQVTCTINLRSGVIRDYEVAVEGTRAMLRSRARVPVNELRIIVISYAPVQRVDVPEAARDKLSAPRVRGGK